MVALPKVVKHGGLVEVSQVRHVFHFVELGRVHLECVVLVDLLGKPSGQADLVCLPIVLDDVGRDEALLVIDNPQPFLCGPV